MNELEAAKTKDPFYIIAHMANNRETLDWAVSQGANGIESDFQFNNDGYPSVIEHGWPCDCRVNIYKDSICRHGLHGNCSGSKARNDPTAHNGVNGKSNGEHGMTYIWTLDKESSMKDYINRGVQGIITNRIALAKRVAVSMGVAMANVSTPPVDKCDCDYRKGGCTISWPAPSKKACKCRYKDLKWTCEGSLVDCDVSLPKCLNPDASKEACQLGQGDCDGY
ncbi:unnamed protein product [Adineta steineri]|nr:unnamed protein product [Adineta steineri]